MNSEKKSLRVVKNLCVRKKRTLIDKENVCIVLKREKRPNKNNLCLFLNKIVIYGGTSRLERDP